MSRKRKKNLQPKPEIGIYCEGDSEKKYFLMLNQKYNASNIKARRIKVTSVSKSGVRLIKEAKKKGDYYHQHDIYVVFDRDDKSNDELLKCKQEAKKRNVKILFSSVCFEIWILMHFEKVMRSYTRRDLFTKLSGEHYFGTDYNRFKGSSYREFIYDKVNQAIGNASVLYSEHNDMVKDDPYTNIHRELENIYGKREVW